MISLLCPRLQPNCPLDAWSSWGLHPWKVLLLGRYCTHFACIVHLSQQCLHFVVTCSCAVCLVCLSSVIIHYEPSWIVSLLVLLVGFFFRCFMDGVCCSGLFIGALRIFTLGFSRPELCFVCHTRLFMWVFYKDWML